MLLLPTSTLWLCFPIPAFVHTACQTENMTPSWKSIAGLSLLCSWTGLATAQASTATTTSYGQLHSQAPDIDNGQSIQPTIDYSQAVDSQKVCPGYTASNVTHHDYGLTATLSLAGSACNSYGTDIESLKLTVEYQSANRIHILAQPTVMDNSNISHYVTPPTLVSQPGINADAENTVPMNDLLFVHGNDPTFWFKVLRKSTSDQLFSTQGNKLVFQNQFVELKSPLPEDYNLYGLGETIRPLRLSNNFTKTMYAADAGDPIDLNIYGSFPVYYDTRYYETDGESGNVTYVPWNATTADGNYTSSTHGVYYRNPHGMEILLKPEGVTWRTIGGNLDLYFYAGPTVEDVAKQVQSSTFGLPTMQQYFTYGYHQCRWGYNNVSDLEDVVNNFTAFQIPLENIWTDIDYMSLFRDFTTDPNRYDQTEFGQFLDGIHANGQHYIPIVDSAIYNPNPDNQSDAYGTYSRGHDMDAFMLTANGSEEYTGAVWPGYTVFPDWLSEKTSDWWTKEMTMFHNQNLSFDGIWIDMSEVSSFCVGPCGNNNLSYNPAPGGIPQSAPTDFPEAFDLTNATQATSASSYAARVAATSLSTSTQTTSFLRTTPTPGVRDINYPPYAINNVQGDLAVHAVSPNATHHDVLHTSEYDVHSLFGYQILNATYHALLSAIPGKRPFIIGRSTFAGAGTVAGHWGGDNTSKWYYMYFSIAQALSFSLFGIPMFGVDACGFNGNTDEELCSRWMQLAAFFPFYRNHNTIYALSQEPYRWASVTSATKAAMDIRYALLPYMYTLFYNAHTTGSTVMRALAWEFPNQPNLADTDNSFLLGPSILVTPVLVPQATTVNVVFPGVQTGTTWYDWYNRSAIANPAALGGANVTIPTPLGTIPVFIRGGCVLPLQPRNGKLVTRDMRMQQWEVLVGLDSAGTARGSLYEDDGESLVQNATKQVDFMVESQGAGGVLYASMRGVYEDGVGLASVAVMGVQTRPAAVRSGARMLGSGQWRYDDGSKMLSVNGTGILASNGTAMGMNATSTSTVGAWSQDWSVSWA